MANFNTRIKQKRDTAANWEKVKDTFSPLDGEIIIVDTAAGDSRLKVGRYDSSKGRLLKYSELPFLDEKLYDSTNKKIGNLYSEVDGKAPKTHTHTKSEVGLGNVDNTADADKSVKNAASATKATQDGVGDEITRSYRKRLGELKNEDFNNATVEGLYTFAGVDSLKNAWKTTDYGTLEVFNNLYNGESGVARTWIVQMAYTTSGKIYTRYRTNISNWQPWREIVYTDTKIATAGTADISLSIKTIGSATENVARHVWFSDSATETFRCHDDNFTYNPSTKTLTTNISGNATKVNNHTVNSDVPANAKFTDTTYSAATSSTSGLMSSADKIKLDNLTATISSATLDGGTW